MNIENVKYLISVLKKIGFEELGYRLLQHICCKPIRFALTETVIQNNDSLVCSIYFERNGADYRFSYYDAMLIKDQAMPDLTINHVALTDLETRVEAIDWKGKGTGAGFRLEDETTWERERKIETVIGELARLSATEEGKLYADALKIRFWSGTLVEQLTGNLAPIRSKLEVSQRFYFLDGECITIAEAIRFLQNRWIEKKVQAKRKENEGFGSATQGGEENASSGNGVVRKKRKVRVRIK